jgi:hypothetical protein
MKFFVIMGGGGGGGVITEKEWVGLKNGGGEQKLSWRY